MVFEILEQIGEVIKAVPAVELLEEEKFDSQFTVSIISKVTSDVIKEKVMKVSEVDKVNVHIVDPDTVKQEAMSSLVPGKSEGIEGPGEDKYEQEQETSFQTAKKQVAATSNKTIRVNIERLDILIINN
ncbi:hypothetical protein [Bacillus sp. SA1-12]|uniref:hypothetical protein n=1 Tax=Bacillus sp. SA1-12 TaxID=1455638 RepID=UPI000698393E|nr:hypothetical protein [Bacillus sp. SA1-12]